VLPHQHHPVARQGDCTVLPGTADTPPGVSVFKRDPGGDVDGSLSFFTFILLLFIFDDMHFLNYRLLIISANYL
jgi:hypothetical protein